MAIPWRKTPADDADFEVDWVDLLEGDTITGTPVWTVTVPSGLTLGTLSNTTTTTKAKISGGNIGQSDVTVQIATAGGRTWERCIVMSVEKICV